MNKSIDQTLRELQKGDEPIERIDAVRLKLLHDVQSRSFHRGPSPFVVQMFLLIAVFALTLGGTTAAAQHALPGDVLYSVKRISEEVMLGVQLSTEGRIRVQRTIVGRRFLEAQVTTGDRNIGSSTGRYQSAIRDAASTIRSSIDYGDPETIISQAESFDELLTDQADQWGDRQDMIDDAYINGVLQVSDTLIEAEERRIPHWVERGE